MDEAKRDLVREWALKARHDLEAAHAVTDRPEPLFDIGSYHCQQAAEKAVKAYLALRDEPFPKTHDLVSLIDRASVHANEMSDWRESLGPLTRYATNARYPGLGVKADRSQYEQAERAASGFLAYVFSLLPDEVLPAF